MDNNNAARPENAPQPPMLGEMIGRRLRVVREARRMSLRQLGQRIERIAASMGTPGLRVSYPHISDLENEYTNNPGIGTLLVIAAALRVSLVDLLGDIPGITGELTEVSTVGTGTGTGPSTASSTPYMTPEYAARELAMARADKLGGDAEEYYLTLLAMLDMGRDEFDAINILIRRIAGSYRPSRRGQG